MAINRSPGKYVGALSLVVASLIAPGAPPAGAVDTTGRGGLYGKPAPDFRINGPHGETYTLKKLRGNILVLQFGTSW